MTPKRAKAIPLVKLVCGNCKLRDKRGICGIDGTFVKEDRMSCFHIFKNYEDRGREERRPRPR